MSNARPRPVRRTKNRLRFVDAADRADTIDSLTWAIGQYRQDGGRYQLAAARRLTRRVRTLRGIVIGA